MKALQTRCCSKKRQGRAERAARCAMPNESGNEHESNEYKEPRDFLKGQASPFKKSRGSLKSCSSLIFRPFCPFRCFRNPIHPFNPSNPWFFKISCDSFRPFRPFRCFRNLADFVNHSLYSLDSCSLKFSFFLSFSMFSESSGLESCGSMTYHRTNTRLPLMM